MPETSLAFFLSYLLGLFFALTVRPLYGLYTYIAVFYLDPPSRWWGEALPNVRWSLVAALVTAAAIAFHSSSLRPGPPVFRSPIARILLLYTLWMWIQLLWVESPYHLEGTILFTKYVVLFSLIYLLIDNKEKLLNFGLAHVLGCLFFGWLAYQAPPGGRLEGVGGPGVDNANTLAMHLGTGLMFASFLLLAFRGWKRWAVLISIPFIINGIFQTGTRGAIVGLAVGGIATVFLKPKRFNRIYYTLAALAVLGAVSFAGQAVYERLATLTAAVDEDVEWDSSATSRIAIVEAQIEMFKDHPLGVGHEGTTYLSRSYIDEQWLATNSGDRASHNTVMSVLVNQGIPGIVLLLILLFHLRNVFRQLKEMDAQGLPDELGLARTMLAGALVTALASGMFAQYLIAEVQIWCLALVAVVWRLATEWQDASGPPEDVTRPV